MKAKIDTGQISFFSNGENLIDYTIYGAAGGVGERTSNVMPSAEKQTIELDGMTLYCDGQGQYTISGTNERNNDILLMAPLKTSFIIPISKGAGGNGTFDFGNSLSLPDNYIIFYNNNTQIDSWKFTPAYRQGSSYMAMGGKPCNKIGILVNTNYSGIFTFRPIFTDDGEYPEVYEPYGYKIPITCGGTTTNVYLDEPLYEGDSITFSMAQVDIPTNNGQNTLTVDTQVKPSKIMVKTNEGIFQNPPENKSFSDYHYNRKMDTRNKILRAWATKDNGRIVPKSWNHVQFLVKHGLHKDVFHIKDQFIMQKGNTNLVWDIIGKDHDAPADNQYNHSMTLQLHDCLPTVVQFDAREAFYYAETEMPAGTYNLTIGAHAWVRGDVGKTVQFTLIQAVPIGGQLVFNQANSTTCVGGTISTFASATATTAIETVAMIEGDSGTSLGTINNTVQAYLNSMQRALVGSNNYKESAIRQWLNSNKPAGSVWKPQTKFDRPPSWVSTLDGFMYGMDADFLSAIGKTHIVVSRNTVCDGGGYDEMDDYFFLLSKREAYMDDEVSGVIEGEPYPYYSDYSDLSTAGKEADSNRIKYINGTAQYWWERTPYSGSGGTGYSVYPTGAMGYAYAYGSYGVAPACNII